MSQVTATSTGNPFMSTRDFACEAPRISFLFCKKWCSEHQAASPLPHEIYIYYIYIYYMWFPEMGVLIRFSIINISKPSILGYHHGKPHQSTYSLVFDVAKDLHNHPKSRHSTLSVEVCPALPGKISVKIRGLIDIDTRWCPQDS